MRLSSKDKFFFPGLLDRIIGFVIIVWMKILILVIIDIFNW